MNADTPTPRWNKISAYLSGELETAERLAFESWLQDSKANQQVFEEAKKIWASSRLKLTSADYSTDAEVTRLMERLQRDERSENVRFFRSPWLRVAAAVIFLVVGSWFYTQFQGTSIPTTLDITHDAGGKVATLYLPDSSRVWLNVGSSISYNKDFNVTERRIYLKGEGYFEVRSDSTRPFRVLTETTITRVVGTEFNVKETDTLTTLTVKEGKVNFSRMDNTRGEVLRVVHGEQATFHHQHQIFKKSGITNYAYAGWRRANNPAFEKEKENPVAFLTTRYAWRKDRAHQSEVYGQVWNHAELATYKNVILKVTYATAGGKPKTMRIKTERIIYPGQPIDFRKKLRDLSAATSYLKVEVESAELISG
jgi:transmembrane sensor